MKGLVKVRLGKKDFLIPYKEWKPLVRITSHPLDPGKLLVWRREKETGKFGEEALTGHRLVVNEARREGGSISEGDEIAALEYDAFLGAADRKAWVRHFIVEPGFRRKTVGTALVETLLQDLKSKRVKDVWFPPHLEARFYLKRGFKEDMVASGGAKRLAGYVGDVGRLGVKPAAVKLRVLWQRANPRFAK